MLRTLGLSHIGGSIGALLPLVLFARWSGSAILPYLLGGGAGGLAVALLPPAAVLRLAELVFGESRREVDFQRRLARTVGQRRNVLVMAMANAAFFTVVPVALALSWPLSGSVNVVEGILAAAAAALHVWSVAKAAQDLQVAAAVRRD